MPTTDSATINMSALSDEQVAALARSPMPSPASGSGSWPHVQPTAPEDHSRQTVNMPALEEPPSRVSSGEQPAVTQSGQQRAVARLSSGTNPRIVVSEISGNHAIVQPTAADSGPRAALGTAPPGPLHSQGDAALLQAPRRSRATEQPVAETPTPPGMDSAREARGHTRRPNVPTTVALELGGRVDETVIEGLDPVTARRRRNVVEAQSSKRQTLRRAAPLIIVLLVGVAGLGAATYSVLFPDQQAVAEPSEGADVTLTLSGGTFTLGLTDDNKESVLSACFRISDNPNHECRRSYLEGLGEYPARRVEVAEMRFDKYEVTNQSYAACAAEGRCPRRDWAGCQFQTHRGYQLDAAVPDRMRGADLPAVCVTRDEAEAFCGWAGGHLPTPDEWERAARGGDDRLSPWGELWAPSIMNWAETDMGGFAVVGRLDGYDLTAPVDSFEDGSTPEGVYNIQGNVAEWVAPAGDRPDGTRGGSYSDDLREYRITYQRPLRPEARRSDVGLRCAY